MKRPHKCFDDTSGPPWGDQDQTQCLACLIQVNSISCQLEAQTMLEGGRLDARDDPFAFSRLAHTSPSGHRTAHTRRKCKKHSRRSRAQPSISGQRAHNGQPPLAFRSLSNGYLVEASMNMLQALASRAQNDRLCLTSWQDVGGHTRCLGSKPLFVHAGLS
jgi:hypothetical protein